jgi:hypothetical protein
MNINFMPNHITGGNPAGFPESPDFIVCVLWVQLRITRVQRRGFSAPRLWRVPGFQPGDLRPPGPPRLGLIWREGNAPGRQPPWSV